MPAERFLRSTGYREAPGGHGSHREVPLLYRLHSPWNSPATAIESLLLTPLWVKGAWQSSSMLTFWRIMAGIRDQNQPANLHPNDFFWTRCPAVVEPEITIEAKGNFFHLWAQPV